jgi:hypothetical protein
MMRFFAFHCGIFVGGHAVGEVALAAYDCPILKGD